MIIINGIRLLKTESSEYSTMLIYILSTNFNLFKNILLTILLITIIIYSTNVTLNYVFIANIQF